MADLLIENVRVLRPRQGVAGRSVLVKGDTIAAIDPAPEQLPEGVQRVDGGGALLTPGLIDLHTHGMGMHGYEASAADILAAAALLPRHGVTGVMPTLYRELSAPSLPRVRELAGAMDKWSTQPGARLCGFHMEGPFLARTGAGGFTFDGDLQLLNQLIDAAGGHLAAMSISPDTPNILPVIRRLVEVNAKVLMTHTCANIQQTQDAIDTGASHATHFYDVFHLPGKADAGVRPVGSVEVILSDDRVSVDYIADGVHVHPVAIKLGIKAKGIDNVLLITDSNIGAGLTPGIYDHPAGHKIDTHPNRGAREHAPGTPRHGILSGSALTMDAGIANLRDWLDLSEADLWATGTLNVARRMGLANLGDIAPGLQADLVLWGDTTKGIPQAKITWVAGREVWRA